MQLETIIKRNGEEVPFDPNRIENAIHMAFLSDNNSNEGHSKNLTSFVYTKTHGNTHPKPLW